jgi:hypothetical protein
MLHLIVVLSALAGFGANLLRVYREVRKLHHRRSKSK